MTVADAVRNGSERLRAAGIESAHADARALMACALGVASPDIAGLGARALQAGERRTFDAFLRRRLAHEPVAYITGRREFWSLEFEVSPATLIPRPDTETIVETALTLIPDRRAPLRILDLGTGTGCILLSLLHEFPHATGLGVDVTDEAVLLATRNALRLQLAGRAFFKAGHWFSGIDERFDLIVSNPPYIPHGEVAGLMADVKDYEPLAALDGGGDGLDAYRAIAAGLTRVLKRDGLALVECGHDQAAAVAALFSAAGFRAVRTFDDLGGTPRVIAVNP